MKTSILTLSMFLCITMSQAQTVCDTIGTDTTSEWKEYTVCQECGHEWQTYSPSETKGRKGSDGSPSYIAKEGKKEARRTTRRLVDLGLSAATMALLGLAMGTVQ